MIARELTTVVEAMTFTECPRWRDGRLYFADFYTHRVMSVVPGGPPPSTTDAAAGLAEL